MWYVIQTVTGKELELVHTIRKGVIREKQRQELEHQEVVDCYLN